MVQGRKCAEFDKDAEQRLVIIILKKNTIRGMVKGLVWPVTSQQQKKSIFEYWNEQNKSKIYCSAFRH